MFSVYNELTELHFGGLLIEGVTLLAIGGIPLVMGNGISLSWMLGPDMV